MDCVVYLGSNQINQIELAGGFFTTEPPGKPMDCILYTILKVLFFVGLIVVW